MLCDGLSGAELDALIVQLKAAYLTAISGGAASVVAGENRRIEYTRANSDALRQELMAAQREKQRQDPNYEPFGALGVEF